MVENRLGLQCRYFDVKGRAAGCAALNPAPTIETAAVPFERPVRKPFSFSGGTVRQNLFEDGRTLSQTPTKTKPSSFLYFKSSPVIISLAVMLYIRFPLFGNVEVPLHERGIYVSHEGIVILTL